MFMDVATSSEVKKYDMLYAMKNKGSATVFALRVVKDHWDVMIAKRNTVTPLPDKEVIEEQDTSHLIKFNYAGRSWYESKSRSQ